MSVPIEATTVVVKNTAIERSFAGGTDAFSAVVPNATLCSDGHISRISFMSEADADQFVSELSQYQLVELEDFVVVRVSMPIEEQVFDWLGVARYEKSIIGWLDGTDPGKLFAPEGWRPDAEPLQHYSAEQIDADFEFLEENDGVLTYRNRETGERIYSARTKSRAEKLMDEAVAIADPYIKIEGQEPPDENGPNQLARATEILEQAVSLEPDFWGAWWFLGKCWQALEEPQSALKAFRKAADTGGDSNPNVWREYMFECIQLGDGAEGVRAADRAVALEPENDGLVSNRALAYLIAGRVDEATKIVKQARRLNRKDQTTKNLQRMIKEVRRGKRPQPSRLSDL